MLPVIWGGILGTHKCMLPVIWEGILGAHKCMLPVIWGGILGTHNAYYLLSDVLTLCFLLMCLWTLWTVAQVASQYGHSYLRSKIIV